MSTRAGAARSRGSLARAVISAAVAVPVAAAAACSTAPAASQRQNSRIHPSASQPSGPPATPKPYPRVNAPCKGKIPEPFAGIATNGQFAANVASFRHYTGARLRLVEFYNRFPGAFQSAEARQVTALGALPLIQLNPRRVTMAQVAAGRYDAEIRSYADQVKAFGCHVVLSFGHEMNGWWYPWGLPDTTPGDFKAAWRHLHDVFAAQRVRNVIWSWDPTHQHTLFRPGRTAYPASTFYPGDRYVDWIGIDGYIGRGQNFNQVFGYQLRDIRRVTARPIYLAETGVGDGSHAARQMASLFAGLWRWHLSGLVWFDLNRKNSWSLDGKPVKDAAYRRAVARFP